MKFGFNVSNGWMGEPYNLRLNRIFEMLASAKAECVEAQLKNVSVMTEGGAINRKGKNYFFNLAASYDFEYTIHAPFPYYAPVYLEFLRGKRHKRSINILKSCTDVANELDAKIVVVHPSHSLGFPSDQRKYQGKIIRRITENLKEVVDYIEKNGYDVKIALETMSPKPERMVVGDRPREIIRITDALGSEHAGIAWDMCHTYKQMLTYKYKVKDFKPIAERTIHIHHSDYSPLMERCHCPQGFGVSGRGMTKLLKGYNDMVISEVSPKLFLYLDPMKTPEEWLRIVLRNTKKTFMKKSNTPPKGRV